MHIEVSAGEHIGHAAKRAVAIIASRRAKRVRFKFNGMRMLVKEGDTPGDVARHLDEEMARIDSLPWNVRLRERYEREYQERRALAQFNLNRLLEALSVDAIREAKTAVRWLCEMQPHADFIGVAYDRSAVLAVFEAAGYKANECTKEDGEDTQDWLVRVGPEGAVRWLIGQGMDGIVGVGAPHSTVRVWAERCGLWSEAA